MQPTTQNTSGLATMGTSVAALPLLHWIFDPARAWPPPDAVLLAILVGIYAVWHVIRALALWYAAKRGIPQDVLDQIASVNATRAAAGLPAATTTAQTATPT